MQKRRIAVQTIRSIDSDGYPSWEHRYFIEGENESDTDYSFDKIIERHQSYNPNDKIRVFYIEEITT